MAKHFASHTNNEILQKRLKSIRTTTERAIKVAGSLQRQYLAETNDDAQFELFSPERPNLNYRRRRINDFKARDVARQNQN